MDQFPRHVAIYKEDDLEHNFEYPTSGNQVHTQNIAPLWEKWRGLS